MENATFDKLDLKCIIQAVKHNLKQIKLFTKHEAFRKHQQVLM